MTHERRGVRRPAAIERHPCPTCDVPADSACRTGAGKTAAKYHTRRLQLVHRVAEDST
ncbi:zinc finger domain-containing protein [Streptomyces lavendulae]|uniref:zinc finger domain-containing protein n=1 Tax=Streptomyces lavendulae TaxID=1914 RepID=UPI003F4D526F